MDALGHPRRRGGRRATSRSSRRWPAGADARSVDARSGRALPPSSTPSRSAAADESSSSRVGGRGRPRGRGELGEPTAGAVDRRARRRRPSPITAPRAPNARSASRGAGDDERARALAEQQRLAVGAAPRSTLRADAAGEAALGQRDGEAALGDVVRRAQRARRARPGGPRRAARAARRGRPAGSSPASGSPRSLASSEPVERRRPRAGGDQRDRVALARRSRAGRRARASGSSPTMPTTGVG